jgi:hypothetical protein
VKENKMRISAVFGSLIILAILSGCSSLPNGLGDSSISYIKGKEFIAKDHSEIYSVSSKADDVVRNSSPSGEVLSIENVPALSGVSALSNYRPDSAYAIGYPKECGGSFTAWNYQSKLSAAKAALSGCLLYREGFEEHTDASCSCRLILINKTILAHPDQINFRRRTPVTLYFRPPGQRKPEIMQGMIEYAGDTGTNLPMKIYNFKGNEMCRGSYSISMLEAVAGSGNLSLSCFPERVSVNGEIRIKRLKRPDGRGFNRVVVGIADTSSGDSVALVAGIPYSLSKEHPELLEVD